jgi:hypothetical protein
MCDHPAMAIMALDRTAHLKPCLAHPQGVLWEIPPRKSTKSNGAPAGLPAAETKAVEAMSAATGLMVPPRLPQGQFHGPGGKERPKPHFPQKG